jgi:hypothetical protein
MRTWEEAAVEVEAAAVAVAAGSLPGLLMAVK